MQEPRYRKGLALDEWINMWFIYNRISVIKTIPLLSMALMAVSGCLHPGKKEVHQVFYKAEERREDLHPISCVNGEKNSCLY